MEFIDAVNPLICQQYIIQWINIEINKLKRDNEKLTWFGDFERTYRSKARIASQHVVPLIVASRYNRNKSQSYNCNKSQLYFLYEHGRLRWCLFFGWIEKAKYFGFFYSGKSNILTSSNIVKMNLLSISSV